MTDELTVQHEVQGLTLAQKVKAKENDIFAYMASLSAEEREEAENKMAEYLAQKNFIERKQADVNRENDLAGIDIEADIDTFLNTFSSANTRRLYRCGLDSFKDWTACNGKTFLTAEPADADDFIYSLRDVSAGTIRARIAAVSSFYTWLERRHRKDGRPLVNNPFKGTRARPKKRAVRSLRQPTEQEVQGIIENAKPEFKLAFSLMANDGLRIGGLSDIEIKNGKYRTFSKGKEYNGFLSEATKAILAKWEYTDRPYKDRFSGKDQTALAKALNREQERIMQSANLTVVYNPHSFRHFFACRLYGQTKDVLLVSRQLHHASIQVTETYLRKLNIID